MKKQKIIYTILIAQGILSLFFSIALFFVLPHQFSEAISHYVTLAPVIRNYYCTTLLITGLLGIFSIATGYTKFKQRRASQIFLAMIMVETIFGLLIYPLVEMFYQTRTGVIQETIVLYRNALMYYSIYLLMHTALGVYSVYCWSVKTPTKKHVVGLCAMLLFIIVPSCILTYQKYYEPEEVYLTENLKFEFVGANGNGTLKVISNDNRIQEMFPTFMGSLTYEVINNGQLANGQQVAITVQYDTAQAKQLCLDIVDAVKTVEVTGLREFYTNYATIPSKIVEEARIVANEYVQSKLLEVLPGKETQVSTVAEYYIMDQEISMDSVHALVVLYRISYVHQEENFYYYRACHVNNIHSDALKDLEILEAKLDNETYRSSLCQTGVNDISNIEAKAHINAMLSNQYDSVEEVEVGRY